MAIPLPFTNTKKELRYPRLGAFYDGFAQPIAWTALRVATGAALIFQGLPLIKDPMSMTGFFDSIGFMPGTIWSPVLTAVQVLGGALILLGLYTRPAALAVGIMLLVTLWYHLTHPFGSALLTRDGMELFAQNGGHFTREAYVLLADGGRNFVETAQAKAVLTSLLWSGAAFLFAAFGGGYMSLDRKVLRKRF